MANEDLRVSPHAHRQHQEPDRPDLERRLDRRISNPLEAIEQITHLLFLRRLDDLHTLEENKSARLGKPMERRIFPKGKDSIGKDGGRTYEDLRWSRFKPRA